MRPRRCGCSARSTTGLQCRRSGDCSQKLLAAVALVAAGLGWHTDAGGVVDIVLTVVWIAGIVNAFNLMDNLDGACSTVGCVCAAGIGTLAAIHGQTALAGLSFALAGGCAGLPAVEPRRTGEDLPRRRRQHADRVPRGGARRWRSASGSAPGMPRVLTVAMLAGLPILDTALVSFSRRRRGVHAGDRRTRPPDAPTAARAALPAGRRGRARGHPGDLCALAIAGDQLAGRQRSAYSRSGAVVGRRRGDRSARHRPLAPGRDRRRARAARGARADERRLRTAARRVESGKRRPG